MKSFKEIHKSWDDTNRVPGLYLNTKKFYINMLATRTNMELPASPNSSAVISPQKLLVYFESWAKLYQDEDNRTPRFPFGMHNHWVEIVPHNYSNLGSAFLTLHIAPQYLPAWYTVPVRIIGCVPRKAYSLMNLHKQSLINTGRIVQMKSVHRGKYKKPRILFPYGSNTFDENLGAIEELSLNSSSEDNTPECDFSMDDL